MIPTLHTDRLILREITPEDAQSIFSYFSNDTVTQHYGMKTFERIEEAERLVVAFATSYKEKRGIRWAIERKSQQGLIGTIGFNLWSSAHRRAEVGYELHPDFWRKGYSLEALKAVVEFGFKELQLTRIGAVVYIENEASNQLLHKFGFEKEGILKQYMVQNNKAHDVNIYAKFNPNLT